MSSKPAILDGIKVVEAATMVMVPSVGAILAEYGADVVKIESLEGDLNRRGHHIPGMPDHDYEYCFLPDNRNKKSLAINLKDPAGLDVLYRLVDGADIFLTNLRRKALDKLAIDYPALRARNPRLIYAHGTGFGDAGAEADKPGFDAVSYWSRSGMEASLFPIEGWLGATGYGTGDHPSGMALFSAVMLALFQRQTSGEGCRVTTSLLANGVWSNSVMIQARLCEAKFHERKPREEAYNFTSIYYRSRDERVFRIVLVDVEAGWPKVCRAIGREDLIDDPRYATLDVRLGRMRELIDLCDDIFAQHGMDHWMRELEKADLPFSMVANYDDVAEDEQMAATDVWVDIDDPEIGRVRSTHSPIRLDGHDKVAPRPAPRHGEHSQELVEALGIEAEKVQDLFRRGVVK